jgi:uncharacterized tellurite resistance protein B-like protein
MTEPASIVSAVGAPTSAHLAYAATLLGRLPEPLMQAAHSPSAAIALLFALAVADAEGEAGEAEWNAIRKYGAPELESEILRLLPLVRAAGVDARLPLLDLALPALQNLSPDAGGRFLKAVEDVVLADDRVRLFEFTMIRILTRRIRGPARDDRGAPRISSFSQVRTETEALLSALAWAGSGWEEAPARAAFSAGAARLPADVGQLVLAEQSAVSIERVDRALLDFQHATPAVQKRLLEACAEVVVHDRKVERIEMELLRAVAESLDCPIPPLIT